jgi:hypothetical protein
MVAPSRKVKDHVPTYPGHERGGMNTIGKEHFTSLYGPARVRAFTRRTPEALASLQDQIMIQYAHALDEASKWRLHKH